jgi:hypothetical protein
MQKLYDKQKAFFSNRKTSNYIFVVDKFDESLESLEDGAFHLSQFLYNEFKVKMENSVLAIFSIETRRITIRTGEITKNNLKDNEVSKIISSLGDLLRQNNYYEAFLKYYDQLDKYIVENYSYVVIILYIFFGVFFFGTALTLIIIAKEKYEDRKKSRDEYKINDIVSFLKSQKTNKKIFEENCIICLKDLKVNIEKNIEKNTELMIKKEEIDNKPSIEKIESNNNNLLIKEGDDNT